MVSDVVNLRPYSAERELVLTFAHQSADTTLPIRLDNVEVGMCNRLLL